MSMAEVVAFFGNLVFWVALVLGVLYLGRGSESPESFRNVMLAQRTPALVIGVICLVSGLIAGKLDIGRTVGAVLLAVIVFCQALIGLAIARGIRGFEPLAVTRAFQEGKHPWRTLLITLVLGLITGAVVLVVGGASQDIVMQMTGETNPTGEVTRMFAADRWLSFFSFLAGAGLAEETPYRLVLVSLFWRLTSRRWVGVLLGALAFAAYHLTPLNNLYERWWQFPIAMFVSTTLVGLLWGWLYVRRGYEATVGAHTLQNWLAVMLFAP